MNGFFGWIGGKRNLRKAILEKFPTEGIRRYIEVFGGAGWVLFAKPQQSGQLEVLNDANGRLINLYRCVKYHAQKVQTARDHYCWLRAVCLQKCFCKDIHKTDGIKLSSS